MAGLTARGVCLYYTIGMTSKTSAKRVAQKIPPLPPRQRQALTVAETWYVQCLGILTAHLKRPPSMPELAAYCRRAVNPVFTALCRAESKGHLRRVGRGKQRKFLVVAEPTS
jgi:hypothetical protein